MTEGTSFKGIRWVAFGMIDPTTGLIIADEKKGLSKSGVVLVDGDGQGATTANITGWKKPVSNNMPMIRSSGSLTVHQRLKLH